MYKLILATRYLLKRRITWLALLAVALCVFVVVIVMTVMAGLVGDYKTNNHKWAGDCVVASDSLVGFPYYEEFIEKLHAEPFVAAAAPVIASHCVLTPAGWDEGRPAEIMGIDPENYGKVTAFGQTLHYHDDSLDAFEPNYAPFLPGCVIGIDLALNRDSEGNYYYPTPAPARSFTVNCFPLTARGALARGEIDVVETKTFYFSDTSQSSVAKVDGAYIYVLFADAQKLCGMDDHPKRASAIHVKFADGVPLVQGTEKVARLWDEFAAAHKAEANYELLENVRVQTWKSFRRETIAAVESEQVLMTIIFSMLGIVAVFIVLVVFYMIISHKSKDIGILQSVGVPGRDIMSLFLCFAAIIGVIASTLGTTAALVVLHYADAIEQWLYGRWQLQVWDRQMYAIGGIPNDIRIGLLAVIIAAAIIVCLVGALIPSCQAARKLPVQTLQVNQL